MRFALQTSAAKAFRNSSLIFFGERLRKMLDENKPICVIKKSLHGQDSYRCRIVVTDRKTKLGSTWIGLVDFTSSEEICIIDPVSGRGRLIGTPFIDTSIVAENT